MSIQATRFIIICAARTGSTMLRSMLNSHPQMVCHREVFSPRLMGFAGIYNQKDSDSPIRQFVEKTRNERPVDFLRDYVFYAGSYQAIGAKIKYDELEQPRWSAVFDSLLADREIRVVHLIRENRLRRLVSAIIAELTGVTVVPASDPQAGLRSPVPKIVVDVERCIHDFTAVQAAEARFRRHFSGHRIFEVSVRGHHGRTQSPVVGPPAILAARRDNADRQHGPAERPQIGGRDRKLFGGKRRTLSDGVCVLSSGLERALLFPASPYHSRQNGSAPRLDRHRVYLCAVGLHNRA